MEYITIVNGVYKQTYNWGAPSCIKHRDLTPWIMDMDLDLNLEILEFMIPGNSREENQDYPRKNQA